MKARIRDIAVRAGVSVSTVSRALNSKDDISRETRQRVLRVVEELHYTPSSVARGLILGRTKTLGVIVADNATPVNAEILKGVEEAARELGFGMLLCISANSDEGEMRCLDAFLANRVDGVVLFPVQTTQEAVKRLWRAGVPFTLVSRHYPDLETNYVVLDNNQAGYLATAHLIDLGHRAIGLIAGPPGWSPIQGRLAGYRRALLEHGLLYDEQLVVHGPLTVSGGYDAALQLLDVPHAPSAIFAMTDLAAAGVLKAARRVGLKVPEQLALVGGDNIELSELLEVPLTTFECFPRRMGAEAARLIISQLDGKTQHPTHIVLPPTLIERVSSGAKPG
jgi:DNA-binding LacI/PurR family transcriptional regulator